MSSRTQTVVGIDVGGPRKGFHAVALHDGVFREATSADPASIVDWCLEQSARIVAVDAPCGWSQSGRSRQAERDLRVGEARIQCFMTPARSHALVHAKGFFDWVFNGEKLYQLLVPHYPLYDGTRGRRSCCFETFPHGIVCALAGKIVAAKPKLANRRGVLIDRGYDISPLTNIDYIDAALCAVAAEEFRHGRTKYFGNQAEGFIVLPAANLNR